MKTKLLRLAAGQELHRKKEISQYFQGQRIIHLA